VISLALAAVIFHYAAPAGKTPTFAGDYTGWDHPVPMQKADTDWTFTAPLPADARIEYKFVVDGEYLLDPTNPKKISNGLGGENSVWEGPDYHLEVPDGAPVHPFQRQVLTVEGREVVVWGPEHSEGLPILAYADGHDYEERGRIQNVVANLAEDHKIKPAVIVLISPNDRSKEYFTDSKPYEEFFVNSVLPAVRKATNASPNASDVYVGGSSLGGVISLRLAEDYPAQVAGGVHSQSGAFQVDRSGLISDTALGKLASSTKLYFDYGVFESDLTKANEKTFKTLQGLGRKYGSEQTPEGHNWTAWRHRMVKGLIYLLGR
jgi:enterochelin esterase-like enzyme